MNDSIDLRKRILKMRENNVSILNNIKSEHFKENIKKEVKPEDLKIENKDSFNSDITKEVLAVEQDTIIPSFLKKNVPTQRQSVSLNSNKEGYVNLVDTNEAQFRILANKFNEAVEVILELSDKVKKLEHTLYKNQNDIKKRNRFFYYINIKIVFSLILIPLLILGIFTLPFEFFTLKLIFSDIISSM